MWVWLMGQRPGSCLRLSSGSSHCIQSPWGFQSPFFIPPRCMGPYYMQASCWASEIWGWRRFPKEPFFLNMVLTLPRYGSQEPELWRSSPDLWNYHHHPNCQILLLHHFPGWKAELAREYSELLGLPKPKLLIAKGMLRAVLALKGLSHRTEGHDKWLTAIPVWVHGMNAADEN